MFCDMPLHVYFRCFQILGFGYADLENEVPIRPNSALRIASISKSVTAVMVAKLWEDGRIDLDQRVQHYLPDFPQKYYMNEKVTYFSCVYFLLLILLT